MWFWVKHLTAAIILLIVAVVVLFYPVVYKSSIETTTVTSTAATTKPPRKAAQNFTNFYEQIRYSLDASKDPSKEYIIKLPDASAQLTNTLSARTNTVPPLATQWTGNSVQRKFSAGSKIRDEMSSFADAEGIELIWTLPRDYVVKHYFHSEGDYLNALREIATAIAPDFQTPVLVFLCPKERAAVITDKRNPFLDTNCTHLNEEELARPPVPSPK